MLMVMLTGGIDISIGAIMTASALASGWCMAYYGAGLFVGFLISIAVGILLGVVNAVLIGSFDLPPIIITLGTKSLIEGVVYLTTGGKVINNAELPKIVKVFSAYKICGISVQILIMILLVLFTWVLLRYTMLGRSIIAQGGNSRSAACAGIKPVSILTFAYGYAGAMAAIAGMLNTTIVITVSSSSFSGYEMDIIAALVVGGVSLSGGHGSPWSALLGELFIAVIKNGMTFARVSAYYQATLIGLIIIGAVTIEQISTNRKIQSIRKIDVSCEEKR